MRRLRNSFFIRKPERRPATLRSNFTHSASEQSLPLRRQRRFHRECERTVRIASPRSQTPLKDCLKFNRHVRRLPSGKWIIRPFSTGRLRDRTRRQSQLLRCLLSCSSRCSISGPREPYRRTARAHRFVLLRQPYLSLGKMLGIAQSLLGCSCPIVERALSVSDFSSANTENALKMCCGKNPHRIQIRAGIAPAR
jgi:hypothetical protein